MTERIKNKLKGSKKDSSQTITKNSKNFHKDENESEQEEYYLGKDRKDELKRKTYVKFLFIFAILLAD